MSLERKAITGGGAGHALPTGYVHRISASGSLQLWRLAAGGKPDTMISEQDDEGFWAATSIATGTGSVHVGELHSMGSGGENVTWVNTDSGYAWFPSWQAVKTDGSGELPATTRTHGATLVGLESAGTLGTAAVDYNDTFAASADVAFFKIETVPAETFTGRLRYRVTKPGGKEVAAFYFDAVATSGVLMTIPFKYPLWVLNGQTFITTLTKNDGTFFKVKASASQTTRPYRKSYYRTFVDKAVISEATPIPSARSLETLTGADRLDVLALKNTEQLMPVATVIEWEGAKYSLPVPAGWWACDGSVINSVGSLLHGQTAPDHRGYVVGGAGGSWAVDTVAGSDSYTVVRSNLPNVTLSGTTGTAGTHAHTIPPLSYSTNTSGVPATSSTNPFALAAPTAWTMDSEVGGDLTGTLRKYPAFASSDATALFSDTNHSHSVSGYTTQSVTDTVGTHAHTFTTSSLNGGVTQTAMDMRQRTRYVTKLIKL